jgi:Family of unknown function (DUF5947)
MDRADKENVALLQAMLRKRPPVGERCDFCSTPLTPEHSHVVELAARRILCSCRPCYIVFQPEGAAGGKYRTVPERYQEIVDFTISDAQWDALAIPIGLAFFFHNSVERRMVAQYPSPAGATESLLPLEAWDEIAAAHPALATLAPDVEAALVERTERNSRAFIVPIDAAYELVGVIRKTWKGFDGGEVAHARIEEYFERLGERSRGRVMARTM